jgi:death-on-curing protein
VLCTRLARNHPLADGNKRVALICMREFLARNGATWQPPQDDPEGDQTVAVMELVATGKLTEDKLALWIEERISADPA